MTDKHKYGTKLRLFGGVPEKGGIGANCQTVEYTDENGKTTRILIDAGVKLATKKQQEQNPGLNCIIPDFRQFVPGENGEPAEFPIDAILVTHVHADHLDGLNYMFQYCAEHNITPPPVYGSENTKQTLDSNLNKMRIPYEKRPRTYIMQPYRTVKTNDTKITSVHANHTTPGAYGFLLRTPDGVGYLNQGDNRMKKSHTDVADDQNMKKAAFHSLEVTHMTVDSTSSGVEDDVNVTFEKSVSEAERAFDAEKGKEFISPIISRSIENVLPLLVAAKERGKKVFFDGKNAREAFANWQNISTVYYMENGEIKSAEDRDARKRLAEKGIKVFCADDFSDIIWNYDNIIASNPDSYKAKVPAKDRLVLVSGAFAEETQDGKSGLVKLAEGEPYNFQITKNTAVYCAERLIDNRKPGEADDGEGDNLNADGVIDKWDKLLRLGAKLYINYLSVPVLEAKAQHGDRKAEAILKAAVVVYAQASGHSTKEGTRENAEFITENVKNRKDFAKEGSKLQAIAIHGNDEQRRNSENALEGIEGIETHNLKNGDTAFLAKGTTEVIDHTPPSQQKFLGVIKLRDSASVALVAMDGNYEKTGGEGLMLTNPDYRPQIDRGNGRATQMVDKAHAQEERDGSRQSMNSGKRSSYEGKNGRHGKNGKGKNGKNAGRGNFFNTYSGKGRER